MCLDQTEDTTGDTERIDPVRRDLWTRQSEGGSRCVFRVSETIHDQGVDEEVKSKVRVPARRWPLLGLPFHLLWRIKFCGRATSGWDEREAIECDH